MEVPTPNGQLWIVATRRNQRTHYEATQVTGAGLFDKMYTKTEHHEIAGPVLHLPDGISFDWTRGDED